MTENSHVKIPNYFVYSIAILVFSFIIWNYIIVLGIILILVITVCIIQSVKQSNQKILEDPTEVICISTISRSITPSSTISYYNHCINNTTDTSCTVSTSTIPTFSFPTPISSTIPITLTIPITHFKS